LRQSADGPTIRFVRAGKRKVVGGDGRGGGWLWTGVVVGIVGKRRATGFDIAFCLERSNTRARHQVAPVKKILKPYFDMLQHYSRVITASS